MPGSHDDINHSLDPLKTEMSALTVLLCIWATVAFCAILFIRGASAHIERPAKTPQPRASRYSIAE
ncbi:hypothetical protein CIC12_28050 [Burkholderia sp. SG-MS1]|uniref:hypothetical protein n=1 Tax=Paraburkholderia sp. SG-MS1 TaxID=2023741 RepID=UPI001446608D|nr:hypothetical protein [Paraburkholderia sp. SG-MS1]NKJ50509.1 hypothetical protein [Paraburkholderia sp. SG-MS1]